VLAITSRIAPLNYIVSNNCRVTEQVMSTMNLDLTAFRPRHASFWSQLMRSIGEWHRRSRSRRELMSLDEGTLRDIGLTRCDAEHEVSKPFWMA
jgi:uncharacterized protein YjiS (DUF1127 family)